jgi:hypothetical protein
MKVVGDKVGGCHLRIRREQRDIVALISPADMRR